MGQFAFMIHPLVKQDVVRKYPITRILPTPVLEWILRKIPPIKVSRITGIYSEHGSAEGHFILCPLTSKQFVQLPQEEVMGRVIATGKLAESIGAKVVGLGAFTAVVGDAGHTVAKALNIAVTTGNSYTIATAIEGTLQAIEFMGYPLASVHLAVVGATGSIGQVCAEVLAQDVAQVTLVGRDTARLETLAQRLREKASATIVVSTDVASALGDCDAVITVSSAVDTIIEPEFLKPGAVICDVARPRDVSKRVVEARDDVLVIEGGIVSVPGEPDFGMNFGTPPGTCMACMAETIILAMEERYESFTLGRDLTVAQVNEINRLAEKHGFKVSGFRAFERQLSDEELAHIKQRAHEERQRHNMNTKSQLSDG